VAFRGRGYEHAIDVPGHGRLTGVFSPTRAGRGEQVRLYFEPDGCHVFAPPETGQPETAPALEATGTAGPAPGPPGEASPAVAGPRVG
jgi:iron(III) transport system ATP-binding protein